jgi:hypothetical protein
MTQSVHESVHSQQIAIFIHAPLLPPKQPNVPHNRLPIPLRSIASPS